MVGIDAEEDLIKFWVGADVLDRGKDTGEFFLSGKGGGMGAGGLTANVKDWDAVMEKGVELGKKGRGVKGWGVFAVMRERVWGKV